MIFFMYGCTSTLTPLSQSQPVSAERIYVKAMNTNSSPATLIFVKDEGTWASIGYHQVFIDGKLVASMKTGERLTIDVDQGDHILGILPVAFASTKDEFLGGYATTSLDQYVRAGISYHYRILVDGDNSSRIQRYVPTQGL